MYDERVNRVMDTCIMCSLAIEVPVIFAASDYRRADLSLSSLSTRRYWLCSLVSIMSVSITIEVTRGQSYRSFSAPL